MRIDMAEISASRNPRSRALPSVLRAPARTPSRGWRRPLLLGLTGATALLISALLALPSVTPGTTAGLSGVAASETVPPWNTWTCNPPNLSPTALRIPLANPTHPRSPGAILGASYKFKVDGYAPSDLGITVYLPTAQAVFPILPSGVLNITMPPENLTISGRGWISSPVLGGELLLTSKTKFSTSPAYFSTSKYAVMANAPSGSLTLEFRWHWNITSVVPSPLDRGPWSVPSANFTGAFLPSIFYPAPYVGVVWQTPSPVQTGKVFYLELNGSVANTSFRMVLEYPNNGTEIQSVWENTSANATLFNSTVPITYPDGVKLPAGSYIIHIHDVCGAFVSIESMTVFRIPPLAPVQVAVRPAAVG